MWTRWPSCGAGRRPRSTLTSASRRTRPCLFSNPTSRTTSCTQMISRQPRELACLVWDGGPGNAEAGEKGEVGPGQQLLRLLYRPGPGQLERDVAPERGTVVEERGPVPADLRRPGQVRRPQPVEHRGQQLRGQLLHTGTAHCCAHNSQPLPNIYHQCQATGVPSRAGGGQEHGWGRVGPIPVVPAMPGCSCSLYYRLHYRLPPLWSIAAVAFYRAADCRM